MKQPTIQEFIHASLNQGVWNVRQLLTTTIYFEIGRKTEEDRGEYHYSVDNCHWWLKKGKGKNYEDIVSSGSSEDNIGKKISILEGKKLLSIQFDPEYAITFFDFEDDLFLEMCPMREKEPSAQWYLMTGQEMLEVMSDGTYSITEVDSSEKPSSHQLKKLDPKSEQETARVKKLIEDLAKEANADITFHQLGELEGRKFFMYIVNEYREGRISVDDLSFICELMYQKFYPDSDTYKRLKTAAEIEWEIRNTPIAACYAISELMEFFN